MPVFFFFNDIIGKLDNQSDDFHISCYVIEKGKEKEGVGEILCV